MSGKLGDGVDGGVEDPAEDLAEDLPADMVVGADRSEDTDVDETDELDDAGDGDSTAAADEHDAEHEDDEDDDDEEDELEDDPQDRADERAVDEGDEDEDDEDEGVDATGAVEESRAGGEPELPEDIDPRDLHPEVRSELRTLTGPVATLVGKRLVASGLLLDEDPAEALAHALVARRLAPRVASVREAVGLAAYHTGQWSMAVAELRTYHRIAGRQTHLAVIADCERAQGRPERAVDLYRAANLDKLEPDEAIELLIVAAGARGDMGQTDAAVAMLQVPDLRDDDAPWGPRLRYAYADSLLAAGRTDDAREWFAKAADVDDDLVTDAADRLLELDGVVIDDPAEPASVDDAVGERGDDRGTEGDGQTRPLESTTRPGRVVIFTEPPAADDADPER